MAPSWPRPSAAVRELFRQAAVQALDVQPEWMDELHAASLSGVRMQPIAEDPVLAAAVRRANVANLRHWATANVRRPAERVSVDLGPDILDGARDLVRRGLDTGALDAYRSAQGVAWRRWMGLCFALHAGSAELEELLDVSALSITTFIEDTVAAMSVRMAAERAELTVGMHADRRAVVSLVLEGAPLPRARAEAQLGYGLTGPHTAAVVWTRTGAAAAHQLEAATEAVTRLCSAPLRLTVVAGASVLWVWLPVPVAPSARELAALLLATPDVRIALGRPGDGVDGFRRSHLDATTAQRMLTGPTSEQQVASYDDVRLVALLSSRQGGLDEFTAEVLGDLQTADADLRDTVSTYVRELGSATRTAERLYTHRNTVLRRLTRADELLPRPLAQDPVTVAAALELVRWRGAPS